MDMNSRKEEFSYAYIHAVSAVAGFSCSFSCRSIDNAGIDASIRFPGQFGEVNLPQIDIQVKCTSNNKSTDDNLAFPLEIPAYNKLRSTKNVVEQFLIVVVVPDNLNDWLRHSEEELLLRKCAYYLSLKGEPEVTNSTNKTVYIPRVQVFHDSALKDIMASAALRWEMFLGVGA